jgi:transposase
LLAQVLVAKYSDHLPLYRQERIFGRAGVALPRSTLAQCAGIDSALARVVKVFGAAHPYTAYLFANRRANRMKVLVHDGIGFWLAARRLHQGHFVWPDPDAKAQVTLSRPQLDALVLGLPWSRIGEGGIITVV